MKPHAGRRLILLLVAALVYPAPAFAAPAANDKAAAQALFEDAILLMAAKKYDEACPKLEESQRLDPAMGTRYQLAQCYEASGRTASAWAAFVEAADLARAAGQESRERVARERAASLAPKVSRLVVAVATPETAGLEVRRNGIVVGAAQWGAAIPVDPGTYRVQATGPNKSSWSSLVTIVADGSTTTVRVPALNGPDEPAPAPPPTGPPAVATPSSRGSRGNAQRTVGIVTGGAGIVAAGAGVALGLAARSEYTSAGAHCGAAGCDPQGKQTTDSARQLGNVGTVVFGVGAVLAAAGVVVWLTAPSSAPTRSASVRVVPFLVDGTF